MIYQLIENLARQILEWSIRKQKKSRSIIEEIKDTYSHPILRAK